jgi:hypothetical protein
MTLSSSEYLATAIGTGIGGGGDHQYEATSTSQYGNVIEQWAVVVIPGTFYWSARSLGSGRIQSFDPDTLALHDGEESFQLSRAPAGTHHPTKHFSHTRPHKLSRRPVRRRTPSARGDCPN